MENCVFYTVWQGSHPAGCHIPLHEHDQYELVCYQSGSGRTVIGGKTHAFSDSCFALIAPQTAHDETHDRSCRLICAAFSCPLSLPSGVWEDAGGTIGSIAAALLQESCRQESGYHAMLSLLVQALGIQLTRKIAPVTRPTEKSLAFAARYIEENYHTHIAFSALAAALHLSYSRFGHRFREIYGVSPQQYLMRTRLRAADTLLKSSALSCTEIAYRCGFSNAAQFSALYKKMYGSAPRACRTP